MKIIYFDTETTGLTPQDNHIIEIALLTVENRKITETYDKLININKKLPEEIIELTGITDKQLQEEGVSEESVAEDLYTRLTPGTLMIAHNCQFDLNFIYELLIRHYPVNEIEDKINNIYWLDTLTVFKDRKKYPHKLQDMVEYYNIPNTRYHRAIDDTIMLSKCVRELHKERDDVTEYMNVFGFNPRYGVQGKLFECIRYVPQPYNNGMVGKEYILPLL